MAILVTSRSTPPWSSSRAVISTGTGPLSKGAGKAGLPVSTDVWAMSDFASAGLTCADLLLNGPRRIPRNHRVRRNRVGDDRARADGHAIPEFGHDDGRVADPAVRANHRLPIQAIA